ncbi:hypothetical protein IVA87_26500 [Bradyrhizobium sp. 147]|uniref:hypothetical protein n=1 Tax=Bradyrhizobium sp. 147 TaxID=2782623 RepID=UPI001FFAC765|nr:hypothetical protein [Bradyrhizobium sp. 147]MCK1682855.1 hypothetical protein [Bradyrhizobium sp. 147]
MGIKTGGGWVRDGIARYVDEHYSKDVILIDEHAMVIEDADARSCHHPGAAPRDVAHTNTRTEGDCDQKRCRRYFDDRVLAVGASEPCTFGRPRKRFRPNGALRLRSERPRMPSGAASGNEPPSGRRTQAAFPRIKSVTVLSSIAGFLR